MFPADKSCPGIAGLSGPIMSFIACSREHLKLQYIHIYSVFFRADVTKYLSLANDWYEGL